jgi:N-glycosylase/DNA lyase
VELAVNPPFDLAATLESGQAHRWRKEDQWYSGVVRGNFIKVRQTPRGMEFCCQPWPAKALVPILQSYFRLDDDLSSIYAAITQDSRVADMVARYPGLRVLRQEPWECLIAFICSANSNIPRIHQVMERMAESFGDPIAMNGEVRHAFPNPAQLAEAGEAELRRLGLGFRAPYVDKAARRVLEKGLDLDALLHLPYAQAKEKLMECPGIGPKIADCILVFSLEKMEAFPIDVWVRRALAEWYFPGEKTPSNRVLEEWAHGYFGRYGGYAQQYLFHGRRLEK